MSHPNEPEVIDTLELARVVGGVIDDGFAIGPPPEHIRIVPLPAPIGSPIPLPNGGGKAVFQ